MIITISLTSVTTHIYKNVLFFFLKVESFSRKERFCAKYFTPKAGFWLHLKNQMAW